MASSQPESNGLNLGIASVTVGGFKSIAREQTIAIRPLTILAGANSSGKSSIMQPLLLLKQTLEAPYDPGPLRIDGPNVKFTSAAQMFTIGHSSAQPLEFTLGSSATNAYGFKETFRWTSDDGIHIAKVEYIGLAGFIVLRPEMTHDEFAAIVPDLNKWLEAASQSTGAGNATMTVDRILAFISVSLGLMGDSSLGRGSFISAVQDASGVTDYMRSTIHVPGLRGNPERIYGTSAVGPHFEGRFDNYVASVISHWQSSKDGRLERLGHDLAELGLTWKVEAKRLNDTQVQLNVGRVPHAGRGGSRDLVSIADVGFGVSQTLPVLVALLAAEPGQLVYLEQPEIHLHPRAQVALARVLVAAANRGVRVVAETHSSLLVLAVQTLVAEGSLAPDDVALHWFERGADGFTNINTAELDKAGAFGDWPEDFADVSLLAESRYLDAAEQRMAER